MTPWFNILESTLNRWEAPGFLSGRWLDCCSLWPVSSVILGSLVPKVGSQGRTLGIEVTWRIIPSGNSVSIRISFYVVEFCYKWKKETGKKPKELEASFPSALRKLLLKLKEKLKPWANFMSVFQWQNILNSYLVNIESYLKLILIVGFFFLILDTKWEKLWLT